MKNRLSSNLLFGLAAATFLAMPAIAQEAEASAAPAAEAPAAAPAAEQPAAEPAAQPAPAAEQPKAEEFKTEQAAAEQPKAEEQAAAPAENTNPGEVAAAAGNALDMLKASVSEETSAANMEVKFSGEVEFDAYTGDVLNDDDLNHEYASTFDLNVEVKFNEKWSAFVGLEADGETDSPAAVYNGAYVQYQPAPTMLRA